MPSITDIYLRVFDVIKNAFRVRQVDEAGQDFTPAKEDGNLAGIKTNTDNLDVPLSTRLKSEDLNLDAEKDLQVDVKTMPPVSTEPSFSDITNTPKKGLVDADRHIQVDVLSSALPVGAATEETLSTRLKKEDLNLDAEKDLQVDVKTMPSVSVSTEPSFSDITDTPKKALVDADRHIQVDILNSVLPTGAATQATLASVLAQLDITLSAFRDAITAASPNNKTLNDLYNQLGSLLTELQQKTEPANTQTIGNPPNLDTALSTRLAENTFTGRVGEVQTTPTANTILGRLKDIWDRLDTLFKSGQTIGSLPAGNNNIGDVDVVSTVNPPNLDVPLSSRLKPGDLNLDAEKDLQVDVKTAPSISHGKTIKNATGTISATTTIVSAVSGKKIKVTAFSLITSSTTAVTCTFKDGAGGTAKWTVLLQALPGTISGTNLATSRPDCLFETTAGNALELALSAAVSVVYSISYFDSDSD